MTATRAPASSAQAAVLTFLIRVRDWLRAWPLDQALFVLTLGLFAITRLVSLSSFPIYFFTDEAIQTVQAADFVDNGFRDAQGRLFPTYFQNGSYWNLSTSVYAQIIPSQLFGYSVFATRATSALIALTGAAAVSLTLRDVFKVRAWWLAGAFLTVTPAFFLHSRTAFETVIATSLYAWFLYFYLRYVGTRTPWMLCVALLFGGLTFYSYAAIQIVVVATGLALGLSSARLHIREWRTTVIGLAVLVFVALPYARFYFGQSQEPYTHLRTLDSYWVNPDFTFRDKVDRFASEYRLGLTPSYWFGTNNKQDLVRHQMKGYGHISFLAAPFLFFGIGACLRGIRLARYRALLISLVLAPLGSALVTIQITRALVMVVPGALLSGLGAAVMLELAAKKLPHRYLAGGAFAIFAFASLYMLNDAVKNGPTWYQDYGLYGMQFGGREVSAAAREQLDREPGSRVIVSPSWANGTDVILRFLMHDEPRVTLRELNDYRFERRAIEPDTVFILPPWEFQAARDDPRFTVDVFDTIPYPNGEPGFYVLRLGYSVEADAIFAREAAERRQPLTGSLAIGGVAATITYSRLDIGTLEQMFDHDSFTLGRTLEANPAVLDLTFEQPRSVRSVTVEARTIWLGVTVHVFGEGDAAPVTYTARRDGLEEEVTVTIPTPDAPGTRHIRLEVTDFNSPPDKAHVHIRDIRFD